MPEFHTSTGIIPFTNLSALTEYLILQYPQNHWGFPKGHLESGESFWDTARRELEEETSIDSVYKISDFREAINYSYNHDGTKIYKTVYFYAGSVNQKTVELSHEHQDYTWVPEKSVIGKLTYENEKNVFRKWLDTHRN